MNQPTTPQLRPDFQVSGKLPNDLTLDVPTGSNLTPGVVRSIFDDVFEETCIEAEAPR